MTLSTKHAFQSAIPDGGDNTVVRPSDWNAEHVITLANSRVVGRNTAGSGAAEEVTASQLLDWASNTNGVLLTRTAGTWGAIANVTTDNGDIVIANNASPVAPSAGAKLSSRSIAGRDMLNAVPANGSPYPLQPSFSRKNVGMWFLSTASAMLSFNDAGQAAVGTNLGRVPASTNLATSIKRMGWQSTAGAGSIASLFPNATATRYWRGNAAGLGGFYCVLRFEVSDPVLVTTANMFMGVKATAPSTDVAPSTLTNLIGIGCDNGDTVMQLYAAGAGAQARTSLGANFPVNTITADVYELALFAPPNGSNIQWRVERLNTGDVASGTISAGVNLPSNTTFMGMCFARSNGGTALSVAFDFISAYIETDL